MKTETKEIEGVAYLIGGDKKATTAFCQAMAEGMSGGDKDKEKSLLKAFLKKLAIDFKIKVDCELAENLQEAIDGNDQAKGISQETAEKMIIGKFLTNQYDKIRTEQAKEIAKESNVKDLIASLTTDLT